MIYFVQHVRNYENIGENIRDTYQIKVGDWLLVKSDEYRRTPRTLYRRDIIGSITREGIFKKKEV